MKRLGYPPSGTEARVEVQHAISSRNTEDQRHLRAAGLPDGIWHDSGAAWLKGLTDKPGGSSVVFLKAF